MQKIKDINSLSEMLFNRFFDDWSKLSSKVFFDFLSVKIEQAITFEELKNRLSGHKKLKIKLGIDPTGPDIHLGNLLPIIILRQFQKAGHKIELVIGDFTASIGDPSGRNTQRPPLTQKQIEHNFSTYKKQVGKYLDIKNTKIHHNSKWLSKLTLREMIKDLSQISLSEILQRNDFRERISKKLPLSVAEIMYSYAQGFDSVKIVPDIEVGGRDQLLNFAQARSLMQIHKQKPEVVIVTPMLEGISGDGRKMGKSYGNYIAVTGSYEDKFGKIMSIPDNLIVKYYKAFADIKSSEIDELNRITNKNPLESKKQLAQFLVSIESKKLSVGIDERKKFEGKFSSDKNFKDLLTLEYKKGETFFDLIYRKNILSSKNEIKRLFEQNGIKMIESDEIKVKINDFAYSGILKVGKRKFFKLISVNNK